MGGAGARNRLSQFCQGVDGMRRLSDFVKKVKITSLGDGGGVGGGAQLGMLHLCWGVEGGARVPAIEKFGTHCFQPKINIR